MANNQTLKTAIADVIKANGNNEITGLILQQALVGIINQLGNGSSFSGVAIPSTNPGVVDANIFYLATQTGVYSNFSGYEIVGKKIVLFNNRSGAWVATDIFNLEIVDNLGSSNAESVLSARQGNILNVRLDTVYNAVYDDVLTPKVVTETKNLSYISQGGVITDTVIASYTLQRFTVEANKKYIIKGTLSAAATTGFTGAMFKIAPEMSGQGTPLLVIPNATPSGTVYEQSYTPAQNGNIFFTKWQNLNITLSEVTGLDSKLILLDQKIDDNLATTSNQISAINTAIDGILSELNERTETEVVLTESLADSVVNSSGTIAGAPASYSVRRFVVESGKKYAIKGTLAAATTSSFAGAMFKTAPEMSGQGSVVLSIPNAAPSGTDYAQDYTATQSGNIFLTIWQNLPLKLYEVFEGSKFDFLEGKINELSEEIAELKADLYENVEIDTPQSIAETLTSNYVTTSGAIQTAAASYSVRRYPVLNGHIYKITGTIVTSPNTNYSGAMFKTSPAMSGSGVSLFTVANGATIGTVYSQYYTPSQDGNLFVTKSNNIDFVIALVTEEELNRIEDLNERVEVLENAAPVKNAVDFLYYLHPTNPLNVIRFDPGMTSIFQEWGFIGDSLTSGQHEYFEAGVKKYVNLYEYSWGQCICRACGTTGYNFSTGGQTAKGWATDYHGETIRSWAGLQANVKKNFILSMGTNDRDNYNNSLVGSYPPGDVLTDIDLNDFNNNANTFAGWMGGIIQRVKSIQPRCKIFVVTLPKPAVNDTTNVQLWNAVIRDLASLFQDVYLIDVYTYGAVQDSAFKAIYNMGGHYNTIGYQYYAYMFMTYIDWIVRNNPMKFAEEAYVGTDYYYY